MPIDIAISVPLADGPDLEELATSLLSELAPLETRGLDGEVLSTIIVSLNATVVAVLKTWLTVRADKHKSSVVRVRGVDLRGYSVDEVSAILARIAEKQLEAES